MGLTPRFDPRTSRLVHTGLHQVLLQQSRVYHQSLPPASVKGGAMKNESRITGVRLGDPRGPGLF